MKKDTKRDREEEMECEIIRMIKKNERTQDIMIKIDRETDEDRQTK
jgi:hypothetical protein